ncbi:MAG: hypothetical protein ABIR57_15010 [Aeromicrobium sp.]
MIESHTLVLQSFSSTVRMMTKVALATFFTGTLLTYLVTTQLFGLSRNAPPISVSTSDCPANSSTCGPAASKQLNDAITIQQRLGMKCGKESTLTDVVLFRYLNAPNINVLTFDQALAAATAKQGWVLRYCK